MGENKGGMVGETSDDLEREKVGLGAEWHSLSRPTVGAVQRRQVLEPDHSDVAKDKSRQVTTNHDKS